MKTLDVRPTAVRTEPGGCTSPPHQHRRGPASRARTASSPRSGIRRHVSIGVDGLGSEPFDHEGHDVGRVATVHPQAAAAVSKCLVEGGQVGEEQVTAVRTGALQQERVEHVQGRDQAGVGAGGGPCRVVLRSGDPGETKRRRDQSCRHRARPGPRLAPFPQLPAVGLPLRCRPAGPGEVVLRHDAGGRARCRPATQGPGGPPASPPAAARPPPATPACRLLAAGSAEAGRVGPPKEDPNSNRACRPSQDAWRS